MVHYKRTHTLLNFNDISLKYPEPVRLAVTCIVVLVDGVFMVDVVVMVDAVVFKITVPK